MNCANANPVTIVMIEDDEGHARLIELNIRRAGVTNDIVTIASGNEAFDYLLGEDKAGMVSAKRFSSSSILIFLT
jgi:predicted O-methyltransferase YrrM